MDTFNELVEIVSPRLQAYRNDLYVHDKVDLEDYDGPFIYGFRPTGTDLVKLRDLRECAWMKDHPSEEKVREMLAGTFLYIGLQSRNQWFLHFDGKKLRAVTLKEVTSIWDHYVDQQLRIVFPKHSITY